MKGCLTTLAWLVFWTSFALSLPSCINLPPPAPMGDGAVQQIGLVNVLNDRRAAAPPEPKGTVISVTDKGIAISVPKK